MIASPVADRLKLAFSLQGRIGTSTFSTAMTVLTFFHVALEMIALQVLAGVSAGSSWLVTFGLLAVPCVWIGFVVTAKRLHDLGIGAWFALPIVLIWLFCASPIAWGVAGSTIIAMIVLGAGLWALFLSLLVFAALVVPLVWLARSTGSREDNRFEAAPV